MIAERDSFLTPGSVRAKAGRLSAVSNYKQLESRRYETLTDPAYHVGES